MVPVNFIEEGRWYTVPPMAWAALYRKKHCVKVKLYRYGDTKNGLTPNNCF